MKNNINDNEKTKFETLYNQWWSESGIFKTLHQINPIRLKYIIKNSHGLSKKKILDVGCGGGILTESMAKNGANVTGLDIEKNTIKIAQKHAKQYGLNINYIYQTVEQHAHNNRNKNKYDVITCMELLEHVSDPLSVIQSCNYVLKKRGNIFFSTINRTFKSWLFVIIGAEYILKLLPYHTHIFKKFIKPSELIEWINTIGLQEQKIIGISYDIIHNKFITSDDIDTNYILHATK